MRASLTLALLASAAALAAAAPNVGLTLPVNGSSAAPAAAAGPPGALTRATDPFSSVKIDTPFNVRIEPGKTHAVSLEADGNVVGAVGYKVEGDTLTVTTDATFKTDHPIKLTIQLPATALSSVAVTARKVTVAIADGFRPPALALAVGGASRLVVHGVRTASTHLTAAGTSVTVLDGDLGDVTIEASEAAMVTGGFKVRKLAYVGVASAVLDVAAAPTVSDVVEAEGGSARVVPGGVKERALWSADWTCGLEVATTSGEGLSARATKDSRFTRGADCDGIAATGSGGQLLCFAPGPCAFTDEAHLAMLRVK